VAAWVLAAEAFLGRALFLHGGYVSLRIEPQQRRISVQSLRSHLQCNTENLTVEVVESLGVFSEYHGFVLIVDIFPFENFIDLMECVFHRDSSSWGRE
jgi:hypothetical protein